MVCASGAITELAAAAIRPKFEAQVTVFKFQDWLGWLGLGGKRMIDCEGEREDASETTQTAQTFCCFHTGIVRKTSARYKPG
jgi:hypothetical protein